MLDTNSWLGTLVVMVVVLIVLAVVLLTARLAMIAASRRSELLRAMFERGFLRVATVLTIVVLWIVGAVTAPAAQAWWPAVSHAFLIATILAVAWLASSLVSFAINRTMIRYSPEDALEPQLRRRRTQLSVVRRLLVVLIAVFAIGAVLFTFPAVRAIGTSVLASAGIVSIVAGLAAQSTLGNLIAGIQLAFSDAIRVGDVVVVEGEWGRIGEITLSYVVVNIWDERRLVLPCTYFTTRPFESWTRKSDKVLGTVFLDLDWRVPLDEVRAKFEEIIEATPLWDRRSSSAVVTDAQSGFITVRFVMSAADSGDQWALRCLVREQLVTWLQQVHPEALPVTRVSLHGPDPA